MNPLAGIEIALEELEHLGVRAEVQLARGDATGVSVTQRDGSVALYFAEPRHLTDEEEAKDWAQIVATDAREIQA